MSLGSGQAAYACFEVAGNRILSYATCMEIRFTPEQETSCRDSRTKPVLRQNR